MSIPAWGRTPVRAKDDPGQEHRDAQKTLLGENEARQWRLLDPDPILAIAALLLAE
jgi:hypothetical protein